MTSAGTKHNPVCLVLDACTVLGRKEEREEIEPATPCFFSFVSETVLLAKGTNRSRCQSAEIGWPAAHVTSTNEQIAPVWTIYGADGGTKPIPKGFNPTVTTRVFRMTLACGLAL